MKILDDLRGPVHSSYGNGFAYWSRVIGKALINPASHAVILFRLGSALARTPLRPFAFLVRAFGVTWAGTEIHPDATIGPGLTLVHSTGVVIGGGVVIGSNCRISQGVTLGELGRGARDETWGSPVVGDDVVIGVNAVVLGPCTVGDGAVIGANSVVTKDVPAGAVAAGSPARVIRIIGEPADGDAD
ncbi:MAG: serine O-acetyltransferase [Marmoricola sp.]